MQEMDENLESGGVVKKKSSSGCLIIKKKGEFSGSGVGPSASSRTTNREFGSGGESLEHSRGKNSTDKASNDPIVYCRRALESSSDRKRSRIDSFEFDEYDEFDMRRIQKDYMEMLERSGGAREFGSGSRAVMVEKRKRAYFDGLINKKNGKTKSTDHDDQRSYDSDEEDEDEDEDEANLCPSATRLKSEESSGAIRLQSKSGVLKVMVNNTKKMDSPSARKSDYKQVENKKQFQSKHEITKKISAPSPVFSDSEGSDKKVEMLDGEERAMKSKKAKVEKHKKSEIFERNTNEIKLHKFQLQKSKKVANSKSDSSERSSKQPPPRILPDNGSMKVVKKEEKKSLRPENVTPVKVKERISDENVSKEGKEDKFKRGSNTEKQKLRENIREMLIQSGWKIDYRPRRGRDYLDSVYISPSGTAYWSIVKAYDAFQKQMPDVADVNKQGDSSSFAPLSDDLIKKLTRKTRKKMEEEMKRMSATNKGGSSGTRKSKKAVSEVSNNDSDDDDHRKERLGPVIRQNGKAKKARLHEKDSDSRHGLSEESGKNGAMQARKARKIGRCTLLARNPEEEQNSESDGYTASSRKRTLLTWLIDTETVQLSEKVQYLNRKRTRAKLEGWITKEGIHCSCCSKILTVSKFELHAGSKLRQPFQNVVLASGVSLLECLIDAWNKQEESLRKDFYLVEVDEDDPDDDTCGICADGGDLICCDGCPSTFHQSCLKIKMLPDGDWHCPNCICKFCGTVTNVTASANELQTCCLCEKKYHKSCGKGMDDALGTSERPSPYCGKNCQEIHDHLQKILGVKHELQGGLSWSLLHRTDLTTDTESHGYPQRVECNSKLAVALSVMDECFLPIIDRRSGINQIRSVVYNCGSNFNRLNYCGFYTVVLERGDEIISAASIRLRGTQLAEMPFIGTRNMYRRQGMCRQLLSAVESVLSSLKIEKLVIPAISEHIQTWTGVFGFKPLEVSQRKELKSLNMLVFPGVDMLQKPLVKLHLSENVVSNLSNENRPKSRNTLEEHDTDSSEEVENVVLKSPTDASVESLQIGISSLGHLVRDDGQSSGKGLAVDDSDKILKLSNGQVHEAEEDGAPIEQRHHKSSVEASISNGVELAVMELPPVSSPSKTEDNVTPFSVDFNQDNAIDEKAGDVHDIGRSNADSSNLPMEESAPKLAEESGEDVDSSSACAPLRSFDEKTTDSTVEKIADAKYQLSAADSRFVFDKKSENSTFYHTLDSSATHPVVEKIEIGKNEGDANLSLSIASDVSKQQPSNIEDVAVVAPENITGETVGDEIPEIDQK